MLARLPVATPATPLARGARSSAQAVAGSLFAVPAADGRADERNRVARAIHEARGNLSEVARRLEISRSAAGRRVASLGLRVNLDRARLERGSRPRRAGRILPPDAEVAREIAAGSSIAALARRCGASRRAVQLAVRRVEAESEPIERRATAEQGPAPRLDPVPAGGPLAPSNPFASLGALASRPPTVEPAPSAVARPAPSAPTSVSSIFAPRPIDSTPHPVAVHEDNESWIAEQVRRYRPRDPTPD